VKAVVFLHIPDSPYGSVSLSYRRLAAFCGEQGDSVELLSPQSFPALARMDARFLPFVLPFLVARYVWRGRREIDLAVFHSYTGWVANLVRLAFRRVRTVTTFHGLEPIFYEELVKEKREQGVALSWRFRLTYGWWMRRVLRASCRRSDAVVCCNNAEVRYVIEQGWSTAERVTTALAGVAPQAFVDDRVYASRPRRLLMVSQWLDTKGTRYLAEAFASLVRSGTDVELWCCGTRQPDPLVLGDFPEDVRSRVTNVEQIGQQELTSLYRACDVFVHPSVSEGCSNAQAEAMAAAVPMVVTPTAPAIDLLTDGQGCLFVPKRDARALEAAIRRLLDSPELCATLGQTARRAADALSLEAHNVTLFNLFTRLTRGLVA
jgi:glycosyltransferase involved in cell wall biosynthesis